VSWLFRCPFTLLLAAGVILAAIATGTWVHPSDPATLARWGYGLHDFRDGTWYSLLTSVFLTNRPFMFWGILVFVFLSVGGYECRAGWQRAVLVFVLCDLVSKLAITIMVVLPLDATGLAVGQALAMSDDVGMSAGGFGCLGAFFEMLPGRMRRNLLIGTAVYLLLRIVLVTELFADLLHIVALPLGYGIGRRLRRND